MYLNIGLRMSKLLKELFGQLIFFDGILSTLNICFVLFSIVVSSKMIFNKRSLINTEL